MNDKLAARGLGWVSLAIGLSELLAPRKLEQAMGIGNGQNTTVLRSMGLREIFHGIDILTHEDPTPAVVARVAGMCSIPHYLASLPPARVARELLQPSARWC